MTAGDWIALAGFLLTALAAIASWRKANDAKIEAHTATVRADAALAAVEVASAALLKLAKNDDHRLTIEAISRAPNLADELIERAVQSGGRLELELKTEAEVAAIRLLKQHNRVTDHQLEPAEIGKSFWFRARPRNWMFE